MGIESRREFLRSGAALAATAGAAQSAASASKVLGANDRIHVGLVGCGDRGTAVLRNILAVKNVECVALCDVDDSQAAKALKKAVEPVGQKPGLMTRDFRKVLELAGLDAIIVGTPDHWHALPTVMACQAGKDVYVEKPLALSIGEGRAMVDTARKYDRVVQMGTQRRSATHYRTVVDYVNSGKLGKIRMVRAWAYIDWCGEVPVVPDSDPPQGVDYDLWLGPAPKRPFNKNRFHWDFRWFWDYSGGMATDWGVHLIDVVNWAMGVKAPDSAASVGGKYAYPRDAMETPDTQQIIWSYPEFSLVWEHSIGVGRGPEAREHGVAFHGNEGILVVDAWGWEVFSETDSIKNRSARVFKSAGVPRRSAGTEDFNLLHARNFLDCMRSRKRPNADVEIGHNSLIACHLGNIAQRVGRTVKWDAASERVIGDSEAQRLVMRDYRAPWRLA